MTQNQIRYQEHLENKRSNLEREGETHRSNVANERETKRSNLRREAQNSQKMQIDKDLGYANVNQRAIEADNKIRQAQRELTSQDWYRRAQQGETQRSNLARENETKRANISREREATRSAMTREQEDQRHNRVGEDLASRELAVQSLLKLPSSVRNILPSVKSIWDIGGAR